MTSSPFSFDPATLPADLWIGGQWRPGGTGSPVIRDVLAWIDCTIEDVHEAGDHYLVTGRVQELKVEREHHPLIFFRGGYGSFEA